MTNTIPKKTRIKIYKDMIKAYEHMLNTDACEGERIFKDVAKKNKVSFEQMLTVPESQVLNPWKDPDMYKIDKIGTGSFYYTTNMERIISLELFLLLTKENLKEYGI